MFLALATPAQAENMLPEGTFYYDCEVVGQEANKQNAEAREISLDILHSDIGDPRGAQINLFDPDDIVTSLEGWTPENLIVLSRLIDSTQLYVSYLSVDSGGTPRLDALLEISPSESSAQLANLKVVKFATAANNVVSAQSYVGHCQILAGESAIDAYESGSAQ
ncbi:MAG: hypothetical protein ABIT10_06265 [Alteraurantiacibacter sp.]